MLYQGQRICCRRNTAVLKVWGHAPPGELWKSGLQRLNLSHVLSSYANKIIENCQFDLEFSPLIISSCISTMLGDKKKLIASKVWPVSRNPETPQEPPLCVHISFPEVMYSLLAMELYLAMLPPFSCGYTHSCQLLLAEIKGKKQCISIQRNVYTSYFTWSDDCVGCSVSSKADKCPHYPHLAIVKVNCDLFHGQNPESIQRKSPSPSFLFPHFCVCVSSSFTPPLPPPSFSLSLPLYIANSPILWARKSTRLKSSHSLI